VLLAPPLPDEELLDDELVELPPEEPPTFPFTAETVPATGALSAVPSRFVWAVISWALALSIET
jgi:hypothetical protein